MRNLLFFFVQGVSAFTFLRSPTRTPATVCLLSSSREKGDSDLSVPREMYDTAVQAKDAVIKGLEREKDAVIKGLEREKDAVIQAKDAVIKEKDAVIKGLERENEGLERERVERLKENERERVERLKEKDVAYGDLIKEKDVYLANLQLQLISVKARYGVVAGNRPLVEIGLNQCYPKLPTFSARWEEFSKEYVFEKGTKGKKGTFSNDTQSILEDLGCSAHQDNIKRKLRSFVHELSKSHHRIDGINGSGVVCGGEQPLGCAVGIVVCLLQKAGFLDLEVRFMDETGKDKKILGEDGKIRDPFAPTEDVGHKPAPEP
jgi:hypothetical protein